MQHKPPHHGLAGTISCVGLFLLAWASVLCGPAPAFAGWEPAGGTVRCRVFITDGKVSDLDTGAQLCETVPWSQFRYQPMLKGGHPVRVKTEVEVRFEPRK